MKRLLVILVIVVLVMVLLTGCGGTGTDSASSGVPSGYADSAPAKMLETPDRARAAAQAANDRIKTEQDAMESDAVPH